MRGDLQNRINPQTAVARDMGVKKTSSNGEKPEVDFLSVLNNSNSDVKRDRDAKKLGGSSLSGKESYEEFLNKIQTDANKLRQPKNNLEKDDFLKLFVTQLQNQDPLAPEDGTEMASKLAQFNSLEQMLNVNKTLTAMHDTQKQNRSADLINYIGREIDLNGGRIRVAHNQPGSGVFNLKGPANEVQVEVRDASGSVVFAKELGGLAAGEHKFDWDAKKEDGSVAPAGVYNFSVIAKGMNAQEIPVDIVSHAKITGVDIKDKDGAVETELGVVKFDEIKSVRVAQDVESSNGKSPDVKKVLNEAPKPKDELPLTAPKEEVRRAESLNPPPSNVTVATPVLADVSNKPD